MKATLAQTLLWTSLVALAIYGVAYLTPKLAEYSHFPLENFPGLPGLLAAFAGLAVALMIEKKVSKTSWAKCLRALGFKFGTFPTRLLGIGLGILVLGYLILISFLRSSTQLQSGFLFLSFKFFVAQGFIEEAVFRGLIYLASPPRKVVSESRNFKRSFVCTRSRGQSG